MKDILRDYKKAAISLLTFKPYTVFGRAFEIFLGISAWLSICNLIVNIYFFNFFINI